MGDKDLPYNVNKILLGTFMTWKCWWKILFVCGMVKIMIWALICLWQENPQGLQDNVVLPEPIFVVLGRGMHTCITTVVSDSTNPMSWLLSLHTNATYMTEVPYMCNGINFHLLEAVTYKTMHFVCCNLKNMAVQTKDRLRWKDCRDFTTAAEMIHWCLNM